MVELDKGKQLDVLHDHYKESFGYIREVEYQRNKLSLVVIVLIGVIFFEILYPTNLQDALAAAGKDKLGISIAAIPIPALISVTWTFLLAISLRYCQSIIQVDRQYDYLHGLEDKIAPMFHDEGVYRREGHNYMKKRVVFSDWVGLFYTVLFPAIILTATFSLLCTQLSIHRVPWYHEIYDIVIWAGIYTSYTLCWYACYKDRKHCRLEEEVAQNNDP